MGRAVTGFEEITGALKRMKSTSILMAGAVLLILASFSCTTLPAQQPGSPVLVAKTASAGTEFLVRLEETISTKDAKAGDRFQARTLDALTAGDGTVLRPGALLRGHIDKVEPGHKTGRARIWLTFDDVKTPGGWSPLVADVFDIPGVHSVKVDYNKESEIEARNSNRQQDAEAAAAGAFVGAAPGVAALAQRQRSGCGSCSGGSDCFHGCFRNGAGIDARKGHKA